jgi:cytoskeleton protein RodZ
MSATEASDIRAGIGARLKTGRERAGMTLLQVAERLHVDPKVVEALEAGQFADLGASVYTKGHIKRYSEIVSENTAELLEQYSAATKPVMPDLTQLPKASRHADPRKLLLPSLVVLIGFTLVGSVWWILQNIGKTTFGNPARPQDVTTDESATPDAAVPGSSELLIPAESPAPTSAGQSAAASAQRGAGPGSGQSAASPAQRSAAPASGQSAAATAQRSAATAPAQGAPTNTARTGAAPQSGQASAPNSRSGSAQPMTAGRGSGTRAGTSAGAASTTQITKASRNPPAAAASAEATRLKSIDVTLRFAADSWAEVYDADGQRLFYDIGSANSSHAVTGTPPLRVVLGNAPGVSVRINGRPAKVPPSVVQNDNAQFTINRSGRIVRARPTGAATAESKPNGE